MIVFLLLQQLSLASTPTEVWVHTPSALERAALRRLPLGFAEGQDGNWVRMHADPKGLDALASSQLQFEYRPLLLPGDGFLEPDEMVSALEELATDHPERTELIDLGWSQSGRPIVGLRIYGTEYPERRVRILGAHHGDETSSAQVALDAARTLLTSDSDSIGDILARTEVWVVPHVNPDGVARGSRYNQRNVDLNRNYGFEWDPTEFRPGDYAFSESETRAIRALGSGVSFGAGLSVHAGATNLGWVWNYTTERSPDESLLSTIADGYEESCSTPGFWLTNGADWYITNGDTTDWSYGRHGTLDYTLEVSNTKSPNNGEMEEVLAQHGDAVIAWIDWPLWISGQVIDGENGRGIPASIHIDDFTPAIQSGPTGTFSRPIDGEYISVEVHAHGYQSATFELDTSGESAVIALEPSDTFEGALNDRMINSTNEFTLDVDAIAVELSRPGEPSFWATSSSGGWSVPAHTQAGVWNLTIDGQDAPRALFIPEVEGLVEIEAIRVESATIEIAGAGFGRGSRVWALWGDYRTPVPMQVLHQTESNLILNGSDLPIEEDTIDLLLWTQGEQVGIIDILDSDASSPDEPDEPPDTQNPDDDPDESTPPSSTSTSDGELSHSSAKLKAGGCSVSTGYPYRYVLVTIAALVGFRRKRCDIP
jgi:hypothetical protein